MSRLAVLAAVLFSVASAKECEQACKLFATSSNKYLVHDAKVSCKKHNISPRPTTEDICLSTYRAVTHSACLNFCDDKHDHIEDACGAIAGTTWIPKHNAFRACKTGYKSAVSNIPGLVQAAVERSPALLELMNKETVKFKATKSQEIKFDKKEAPAAATPDAAAAPAAEADAAATAAAAELAAAEAAEESEEALTEEEEALLADEFVFPITIDDGSVQNLVVTSRDDVSAKVTAFCAEFMATEEGCHEQLLPIVTERMESGEYIQ